MLFTLLSNINIQDKLTLITELYWFRLNLCILQMSFTHGFKTEHNWLLIVVYLMIKKYTRVGNTFYWINQNFMRHLIWLLRTILLRWINVSGGYKAWYHEHADYKVDLLYKMNSGFGLYCLVWDFKKVEANVNITLINKLYKVIFD